MELREGYKITELGVIPEDWEVIRVEDIISSTQLGGNYPNQDAENEFPLIKMGNIDRGKIKLDRLQYVKGIIPRECDRLFFGDILFNTRNTLDLVGKVAIWRNELHKAYFNSNLMRLSFNNKIASTFWINETFNTPLFVRQLRDIAIGTTSVAAIYNRDFFKLKLSLSSRSEQAAIATALSDMDTLIAQTEKLIEKKKAIKQGMMQRLFSPIDELGKLKKGWMKKRLGEYGKTYGGITGKSKKDFGNGLAKYIPFMNIMANPVIDVTYLEAVDVKSGEAQNKVIVGDLFFNGSSETPEEIGMCSVLMTDVDNLYLNSFCFGFRLSNFNSVNGLFLAYYFRSKVGRQNIYSLAQGATRYNLSKTNLLNLEITIPAKGEQDLIALMLHDIDEELNGLSFKLVKYNAQKQGMMQSLLTGKIRIYTPQHEQATTIGT